MTTHRPTTRRYDVLGLGCAAVDDVIYVPAFPAVDGKAKVARRSRQCGGLIGTALVAAARLGARCAYAGCLGPDEISGHVSENFTREGIDVSHAPRLPEATVVHSTIIVGQDTGSRTIFYEADGMIGAHPTLPGDDVIRDARVLLVDHYGMVGNVRAAQVAREAGVAVVGDLEDVTVSLFEELLALVDHLILSEEIALQITGRRDPAEAALALWHPQRAAVVVTSGVRGSWSMQGDGSEPEHHPSYQVIAVDTTGCGDVFHGAYAAALARGDGLEERLEFASAAAALKASQPGIPDLEAVNLFLSTAARRPRLRHEHAPTP